MAAPAGNEIWVGVLGPSLIILVQWYSNHKKGKTRDTANMVANAGRGLSLDRIEAKLDEHQRDTRESFHALDERLDKVSDIATEALSHAIGPDGRNGFRARIEQLEARADDDRRLRDRADSPGRRSNDRQDI